MRGGGIWLIKMSQTQIMDWRAGKKKGEQIWSAFKKITFADPSVDYGKLPALA